MCFLCQRAGDSETGLQANCRHGFRSTRRRLGLTRKALIKRINAGDPVLPDFRARHPALSPLHMSQRADGVCRMSKSIAKENNHDAIGGPLVLLSFSCWRSPRF